MTDKSFNAGDTGKEGGDNKPQGADFGSDHGGDNHHSGGENSANRDHSGDADKLTKRLNDSQQFIDTLKGENREMRDQLSAALKTVEELQSKVESQPSMDDILEHVNQNQLGDHQTQEIDFDALTNKAADTLEQRLSAKEAQKQKDQNFESVAKSLREKLGSEGINDKVKQIAAENGMSYDDYVRMAEVSPKAALKLAGAEEVSKPSPKPNFGSVNTYGHEVQSPTKPAKKQTIMDQQSDSQRVQYLDSLFKEAGI